VKPMLIYSMSVSVDGLLGICGDAIATAEA
jgi:hypothetical protein